jgi:hypothetical protein
MILLGGTRLLPQLLANVDAAPHGGTHLSFGVKLARIPRMAGNWSSNMEPGMGIEPTSANLSMLRVAASFSLLQPAAWTVRPSVAIGYGAKDQPRHSPRQNNRWGT